VTRAILAAAAAAALATPAVPAADPVVYKVGIPKTAFRDVPPEFQPVATLCLLELMKEQTGLDGEVIRPKDALAVARALDEGDLAIAMLRGQEYGWAKAKCPELMAIASAVERPKEIRAFLLVRHDCKATGLGDLKGGKLALAKTLKDHPRLFLAKRRADELGRGGFVETIKTDTVHDAIHAVIDGKADVTAADQGAWATFQKLYPGASKNLRVLSESDPFPPAVLVVKKGQLDEAVVRKIREGFLAADKSAKSVRLMTFMHVEKFEAVPAGYEEAADKCRKEYPAAPADE
jgi:ABC-type phosphate/phosphonate transport system substrate-binding protein